MSSNAQILPLFRLVTPTVNLTIAGATTSANKTFNTNIVIGTYMNIRRIRTIIARKTSIEIAAVSNQIIYELSEDTTRTTVAQTDPYALVDGGKEESTQQATAVGDIFWSDNLVSDAIDYLPPHPGVATVAQQLNLVAAGIRIAGSSVQQWDVFLQLYYEILPITQQVRDFLTNRIVLQRTT